MRVLSVKQPWAWAIIHAGKDIENRDWPTYVKGPLAIHASKGLTRKEYAWDAEFIKTVNGGIVPAYEDLVFGAILGTVVLAGCVERSDSPWFQGKYGFVLQDPKPLDAPIVARGALGFWHYEIPSPEVPA